MKILFVTCWYPHAGFPHRGLFIREHARAAARQGCDVKVLHVWAEHSSSSLWRLEKRHKTEEDNLESFSFVIHSRLERFIYGNTPLMRSLGLRYFRRAIQPAFSPDLVQGNVIFQAGMIARKIAEYLDRPYVLAEHFSMLDWYFGNRLLSYGAEETYREAEFILPVSEFLGEEIRSYVDGNLTMKTVPNVVDTEHFFYEPQPGNDASGPIELLMVMNYQNERKRPDLLLKALASLPGEMQTKFRLTMIGRGNGTVETEAYREELELRSDVRYLGELDKSDVGRRMRESDFLMHPTEMETFGVVAAEALCCGLPCVASRAGALPEHVDHGSGVLLENTLAAWRETLRDMAEGRLEFDREAIAERHGSRFTFESVGGRLADLYEEALLRG
ncbi:MAG: glycosyltransferase [Balneolaceae bacterium]|nr:glycosyltransferase [Balneolaceae bacterium]